MKNFSKYCISFSLFFLTSIQGYSQFGADSMPRHTEENNKRVEERQESMRKLEKERADEAEKKIQSIREKIKYAEKNIEDWKAEILGLEEKNPTLKMRLDYDAQNDSSTPSDFSSEMTDAEQHAVLVVSDSKGGTATAFLGKIDDKLFIVSNVHVFGGMDNPTVMTMNGRTISVPQTCFVAKDYDVMLLPIDSAPEGCEVLDISKLITDEAKANDKIAICGNSQGGNVLRMINGKISGIGPKLVEIDCVIYPGNSGSPIFHPQSKKVIGVVSYIREQRDETVKKVSSESNSTIKSNFRYFGYRIDTVKSWSPAKLSDIRDQYLLLDGFSEKLNIVGRYFTNNGRVRPNPADYPEFARIVSTFDQNKGSSSWSIRNAAKDMISKVEMQLNQEVAKLRGARIHECFSEKQEFIKGQLTRIKDICAAINRDGVYR